MFKPPLVFSCACTYAQNDVQKSVYDVCLEPKLAFCSLFAALTKKRNSSESSAVILELIVCICCILFELCVRERKKSEVETFTFNFLDWDKNELTMYVCFT